MPFTEDIVVPPLIPRKEPVGEISPEPALRFFGSLTRRVRSIASDLGHTAKFAADLPSALRIGADLAFFRLLGIVWWSADTIRRVQIRPDTRLSYRRNKGDIYSIHEIWFEESYRLPVNLRPNLLVDLGAHIGMTSLWLAKTYGCEQIIAVEPSAGNAAVARENFANNGLEAEVIEAAVGAVDGHAEFYNAASSTNGRLKFNGSDGSGQPVGTRQAVSVRVVSMDTVLNSLPADAPIDLLKVDIEGGEQDLFTGDLAWLARVQAMLIEFHPSLIDYEALVGTIQSQGLRRVHSVVTHAEGGNTLELFLREG